MTRRSALCFIGGGAVVAASGSFETFGFSNITAMRGATVTTAEDGEALIGLFVPDSIERNKRSLLVEITNNITAGIEGTVSLSDGGYGTLYGPSGDSGSSVTFSLDTATESSTDSTIIEIDPENYEGMVSFTITATTPDSGFSFTGTRETESVKDPEESGVTIINLGNFKARQSKNHWRIKNVAVSSDEFELDRVEYEVTDNTNTVVGTRVDDASGNSYDRGEIQIDPDGGNEVRNANYTLKVTAYDVEDNYDISTKTN